MKQLTKKFLEDESIGTSVRETYQSTKPPSSKCSGTQGKKSSRENKRSFLKSPSKREISPEEDHEGPKKKKSKSFNSFSEANDDNWDHNEKIFNKIDQKEKLIRKETSIYESNPAGLQVVKNRLEMEKSEMFGNINQQDVNRSYVKSTGDERKLLKMKAIANKKANSLPTKHPEAEARTIFVGNVSVKTGRKSIAKYFSTYGNVETVRLRGIPTESMDVSKKEAIVKGKLHPDRSTLIAYVRFKDIESKEKALEANGSVFEGLHLRVDSAIKSSTNDSHSVFVGNLPWEVEEEELWNLFQDCGKIINVRIVRSAQTGAGKGIGFVCFETGDSIEMALHLNGKMIKNRPIRVKRISKKPKVKSVVHSKSKKQENNSSSSNSNPNVNKMKLSFLKQDKPKELRMKDRSLPLKIKGKKKGKSEYPAAAIKNFAGSKMVNKKSVKKQRRPKLTKDKRKKFAVSKLLERAKAKSKK